MDGRPPQPPRLPSSSVPAAKLGDPQLSGYGSVQLSSDLAQKGMTYSGRTVIGFLIEPGDGPSVRPLP